MESNCNNPQNSNTESTQNGSIQVENHENHANPSYIDLSCGDRITFKDIEDSSFIHEYEIEEFLGKGVYGSVYKAHCKYLDAKVALKVMRREPIYIKAGYKEIEISKRLMELKVSKNIPCVDFLDHFYHQGYLFLVFEKLDISMLDFLEGVEYSGMSLSDIAFIAKQMLEALDLVHKKGIIHGDLKPENVLFIEKGKFQIKIIDWGSAMPDDHTIHEYIQSRFYRAPDIFLGTPTTTKIDIWSLGCILAELYIGLPVFPGNSHYDQIFKIFNLMGLPSDNYMNSTPKKFEYFSSYGSSFQLKTKEEYENDNNTTIPDPRQFLDIISFSFFEEIFENSEYRENDDIEPLEDFIDLISNLLTIDPYYRYSAEDALGHPFLHHSTKYAEEKTIYTPLKVLWRERAAKKDEKLKESSSNHVTMSPKDKMKMKLKKNQVQNFTPKIENQPNQIQFSFIPNPSNTKNHDKGCINTSISK